MRGLTNTWSGAELFGVPYSCCTAGFTVAALTY